MTKDPYDITNDVYGTNEPYSIMSRIVDAIFNFLVSVGVVAFAGLLGYLYARYL